MACKSANSEYVGQLVYESVGYLHWAFSLRQIPSPDKLDIVGGSIQATQRIIVHLLQRNDAVNRCFHTRHIKPAVQTKDVDCSFYVPDLGETLPVVQLQGNCGGVSTYFALSYKYRVAIQRFVFGFS